MMQIVAGFSIDEISKQLSISPDTIDTIRLRIMQKIDIDTPAELTDYAKTNGLI